jgi:hypothetical protein
MGSITLPIGREKFETCPVWGATPSENTAVMLVWLVQVSPDSNSSHRALDLCILGTQAGTPMKRTIQVRISRGDRQFVAECLDLPVVTQAVTLDELAFNIREAIGLHR